jgi:hypothetical protein
LIENRSMILPLLATLALQVTPVQPIVKGTGLPPQDLATGGDEAAVLAPITAWFAALDVADAAAIRRQIRTEGGGGATVAAVSADGIRSVRHLSWDQYLAGIKPGAARLHERFTGQPAIEVDGDIAMVWGDYALSVDGRVMSCGVDHFDLVRENGTWRVQNVTWSQRTTCAA